MPPRKTTSTTASTTRKPHKPRTPDAGRGPRKEAPGVISSHVNQVNIADLNAPQVADIVDATDADLARETLRGVCCDTAAPAAARAQAARTLAEMAQALGRHAAQVAPAGQPVSAMTLAEIEAELARAGG